MNAVLRNIPHDAHIYPVVRVTTGKAILDIVVRDRQICFIKPTEADKEFFSAFLKESSAER